MTTPAHVSSIPAQIEEDIANFMISQKGNGRAEDTIRTRVQFLRRASKFCDINDPEEVKDFLANQKYSNTTKTKNADSYNAYCIYKGIKWTQPKYTQTKKLPFMPTEEEIDLLISGTGRMLSAVLQTLKETGMRIGELTNLTWFDLDTERRTLNITPEKGSNPRVLPISPKLIGMINSLPKRHKDRIFQPHKDALRDYLCTQRKKLAERLSNPRLTKIGFHTLRHWKGTVEYHKTKDIIHVKTVLGHKSITSTMVYINLENALFVNAPEDFICKVAHNEQEEIQLIEAGFTHVNNRDGLSFYKKRK